MRKQFTLGTNESDSLESRGKDRKKIISDQIFKSFFTKSKNSFKICSKEIINEIIGICLLVVIPLSCMPAVATEKNPPQSS